MPSPTISDVAEKAGVGIGTVSRVLNGNPHVSEHTRRQVLEAIAALDFKPSSAARKLSRKIKNQAIGIIVQPFNSYHSFAERLRGVQIYLDDTAPDFDLMLYSVSSLEHFNFRLRQIIRDRSVDALVVIDLDIDDSQREALEGMRIPFIGINHFQEATWARVGTDNFAGGYLATRYLLEQGHTAIAYVGDKFESVYRYPTSAQRHAGYEQALREAGIEINPAFIKLAPYGYEFARQITLELFADAERPTAIFAMSDIQAMGCIAALREHHLRVPDDISVIGYDDLDVSLPMGLTTIRQHLELSGRYAAEYLLQQINEISTQTIPDLPPLEVIPRHSTQPLARSQVSTDRQDRRGISN
jgi:LacI family transcriptional regulator